MDGKHTKWGLKEWELNFKTKRIKQCFKKEIKVDTMTAMNDVTYL